MREIAILEFGQTVVGDHWDKSLLELTGEPILQIFEKTGLNTTDSIFVGNMLSGSCERQLHLGAYLSDWVGARGAEAVHVECACASGAAAFRAAVLAVASGEAETAIAVGSEKMTDVPSETMSAELATALDSEYERDMGSTMVSTAALLMQRYMAQYQWKKEDLAVFPMTAHENGVYNPYARFQKAISKESYLKSEMVCPPISVLDAAPVADGAAAVLIVPFERVRSTRTVRLLSSTAASDCLAVASRKDPLRLTAAERSAKKAYTQAGILPKEVDLFEVHDAFTIMTCLGLEACGFCEQGTAPRFAAEFGIGLNGALPIATRGGLKARGHPTGATGIYQIVEAVQQLQGSCGNGQVEGAQIAMTQNIGGAGANAFTNIFSL